MPDIAKPTLNPDERLIYGPDIDADLGIGGGGRTRRKMVKDKRLPEPAGYIGGRPAWRLCDYLEARAKLLASGRPRRPRETARDAV
jgi:hypothetical protein